MLIKSLLAAAVVAPLLTVSALAQNAPGEHRHHYQGGPASTSHATILPNATAAPDVAVLHKASHVYSGGPKTVVPHGN
ncbi:MAG TPA: hypothetical protein VGC77_09150 [Rhodopseudomonas sp.]|uniref:hypothetical protein n=1 Tax=Rhodopseudomonas sp. TaxID=1078 RepID=UPI002ED8CB52